MLWIKLDPYSGTFFRFSLKIGFLKLFFILTNFFFLKIYIKTLVSDPNLAKIRDPDPNSIAYGSSTLITKNC